MRSLEKKGRRRTIGADPLAAIIPIDSESSTPLDIESATLVGAESAVLTEEAPPAPPRTVSTPPKKTTSQKVSATTAEATRRAKKRTTLNMDNALDDAIRDAVFALSGPEVQMNLVRFVEEGLSAHLRKLERKHNEGKAFPRRTGKLRTGRPLSI